MDLSKSHNHLAIGANGYIRFSPTSMICPMVFNMTTFNDAMSVAMNYRKTCYDDTEAKTIFTEFIKSLERIIQEDNGAYNI